MRRQKDSISSTPTTSVTGHQQSVFQCRYARIEPTKRYAAKQLLRRQLVYDIARVGGQFERKFVEEAVVDPE